MRVYRGFSRSLPTRSVLTIGNFDGVHLGHLALLKRLRERADALNLPAAVLTFEPHPRVFFTPDKAPARLSTLHERLDRLAAAGVDIAMVCPFNAKFAALSADDFIHRVICQTLRAEEVFIGDDFRFGAGRQGDWAFLQAAGKKLGFAVYDLDSVFAAGRRVSSSAVRHALAAGELDLARDLLGRRYNITGRVCHGKHLGRSLGFATANVFVRHRPLPLCGVFAVEITSSVLGATPRQGVANVGLRPTVDGKGSERSLLEVHLFDFCGDLYSATISVSFCHKLREEQRFPSIEALAAQIKQDAAQARHFFLDQASQR